MANFSWKTLALLTVTLLVALGLQAGALKIMVNLSRQTDEPAPVATRAAPGNPRLSATTGETGRQPAPAIEERITVAPALTGQEPNPEALLADPPHLATPAPKPEPSPGSPNPEARQLPGAALSTPVANPPPIANPPPVSAEINPSPTVSNPPPVTPAVPAAPPVAAAPEVNPPPATASGLQEAAWIKARDPRRYTVQVYSGKEMNALREISVAVATADPQAYFTTTSRSGPWHSLVIGDYADSATAQAAAAKMTTRLPTIKPWVRRFDEVQAKLR